VDRNIGAGGECREAVEGTAVARMEFVSQNDKLEELLEQFRLASERAREEHGEIPNNAPPTEPQG
jgi:hypothetical protein